MTEKFLFFNCRSWKNQFLTDEHISVLAVKPSEGANIVAVNITIMFQQISKKERVILNLNFKQQIKSSEEKLERKSNGVKVFIILKLEKHLVIVKNDNF